LYKSYSRRAAIKGSVVAAHGLQHPLPASDNEDDALSDDTISTDLRTTVTHYGDDNIECDDDNNEGDNDEEAENDDKGGNDEQAENEDEGCNDEENEDEGGNDDDDEEEEDGDNGQSGNENEQGNEDDSDMRMGMRVRMRIMMTL
jgi:hypothetical protein